MDNISFPQMNPEFFRVANEMAQVSAKLRASIAGITSDYLKASSKLVEAARPLLAANELGKVQFVFWESLERDFIDEILSAETIDQVNNVLNKRFCDKQFSSFYELADKCLKHNRMSKYTQVFNQCMLAFRDGSKDLAIIGLCSVIDGLLSDVSKDDCVSISIRVKELKGRIENGANKSISQKEIAFMVLLTTFDRTIESYDKFADFSQEESEYINRHRIMHGRVNREKTELDCLKILRILYGVLLMDDLVDEDNT